MKEAFGGLSTDWKEGINWAAVRAWRLQRAREAQLAHAPRLVLKADEEPGRTVVRGEDDGRGQAELRQRHLDAAGNALIAFATVPSSGHSNIEFTKQTSGTTIG